MTPRRLVVAATLVCATGAAELLAQQPVFVSRRDVVRLEVLVTERNKAVLGLTAADFRIQDNGVPQQVDFISFDDLPLNVVMNFDVSGSMAGQRLTDLRAAGHALLDQLRAGDRAALVSFNQALSRGSTLTADLSLVRRSLDKGEAGGLTALVDASFAGLSIGAADKGRSVMIVFSDGVDTSSFLAPRAVLEAASRTNVLVSGVGVGKSRVPFLKDLVEATGGDLLELQSTKELKAAFVRLIAEYRQRYLVAYSPAGVAADGWHKVDVRVSRKDAVVKTRSGYQVR